MTGLTSKNGHLKPNLTDLPDLRAVHVGISGFPFGSAAINKCIAVYASLHQQKIQFLLINNRAVHKKDIPIPVEKDGLINNLRYTYTSISPYKSDSFVLRRVSNFLGRINEFFLLLKLCLSNSIDVMFYYPTNGSFFELIYYRLFSKIFGFPIVAQYVEYRTSFKSEFRPHDRFVHYLYDKYFMRFVDGVLPISEYLIDHLKRRGYTKPYIKVPPLTDFNEFRQERQNGEENYFLYVGTAAYLEAIEFITKSFDISRASNHFLHLVVNGSPSQMKIVETLVSRMKKKDQVRLFSNLKYSHLVHKYIHAKALLIPLTDSVQDKARFPQKISEYLASGNPVITTNFGEVPFYFSDQENALVAAEYDVNQFAAKLDFVVMNPEASVQIGRKGKETGLKFFDYNSYGAEIKKMIISLQ
jgi:glycosyltransferase involved in cell wall biosynthesis